MGLFDGIIGSRKKWYDGIDLEVVRRICNDNNLEIDKAMTSDKMLAFLTSGQSEPPMVITDEGDPSVGAVLIESYKKDPKLKDKDENPVSGFLSFYSIVEAKMGELIISGKKTFKIMSFSLSKEQLVKIAQYLIEIKLI